MRAGRVRLGRSGNSQECRGDVVLRRGVAGEFLDGGEKAREEGIGGGLQVTLANLHHAGGAEFLALRVVRFEQAVGEEEQAIARLESDAVLVVAGLIEQAGRK